MKWSIQRICPEEDSVYLINLDSGLTRQISVPGAVAAWLVGELLMIRAKTGFLWEVEPDKGARRRALNLCGPD